MHVLLVVVAVADIGQCCGPVICLERLHLGWDMVMVREDGKGTETEIGYIDKRDDNGIRGNAEKVIKVQKFMTNHQLPLNSQGALY